MFLSCLFICIYILITYFTAAAADEVYFGQSTRQYSGTVCVLKEFHLMY